MERNRKKDYLRSIILYLCSYYNMLILKLLLAQQIGVKTKVVKLEVMTRFEVKKFNGRNDFRRYTLYQFWYGLSKTLSGKETLLVIMSNEENNELMKKYV